MSISSIVYLPPVFGPRGKDVFWFLCVARRASLVVLLVSLNGVGGAVELGLIPVEWSWWEPEWLGRGLGGWAMVITGAGVGIVVLGSSGVSGKVGVVGAGWNGWIGGVAGNGGEVIQDGPASQGGGGRGEASEELAVAEG